MAVHGDVADGVYPTHHSLADQEARRLGQWLVSVRCAKRGTTNNLMTAERAARLESLPGWSWDGFDIRRRNAAKRQSTLLRKRAATEGSVVAKAAPAPKKARWHSTVPARTGAAPSGSAYCIL